MNGWHIAFHSSRSDAFDDANLAVGAVAERVKCFLVSQTVVRGNGLFDADGAVGADP